MKTTKEEIEEYCNRRRGMYGRIVQCGDGTLLEWINELPWEVALEPENYRKEPIYRYAENYTLEIK